MPEITASANQAPHFPPIFDVEGLIGRIEQAVKNAVKQPIQPNAIYDYDELATVSGFSKSTIVRADRAGRLTGRYEGRRRYFLGQDVLDWLAKREGGDE